DALRDWGALHRRLVPGFVTDCRLDGPVRVVTFFTGTVARELLVDLDDQTRRLVWSIVGGASEHHHASAQAVPVGVARTRSVWIGREDELFARTGGKPCHELTDVQVVGPDPLERIDRSAEHVVATAELARPLDRHDVLGLLDDAEHLVGTARIPADPALLGLG